jgi:pilus assembly protein Flp/PilA
LAQRDCPAIGVALAGRKIDKKIRKGKNMANVKQLLKELVKEDSGQDLIEYALVAALVGLGSVAALSGLTNSVANSFNNIGNALQNATA